MRRIALAPLREWPLRLPVYRPVHPKVHDSTSQPTCDWLRVSTASDEELISRVENSISIGIAMMFHGCLGNLNWRDIR